QVSSSSARDNRVDTTFCAVIPTYDNPKTIADVVRRVREYLPRVIVVDDGSGAEARDVVRAIEAEGLAEIVWRETNGGKGAAGMSGLRAAEAAGMTHALLIDADGQHDPADIPRFLSAARDTPNALVLGQPIFDASAPTSRLFCRKISVFWCMVET